jgi:hypothetical protein
LAAKLMLALPLSVAAFRPSVVSAAFVAPGSLQS